MKWGHQGDRVDGTGGGKEGKGERGEEGGEEILHTNGRTDQSKVVQEFLADLKSYGREGSWFVETTLDLRLQITICNLQISI